MYRGGWVQINKENYNFKSGTTYLGRSTLNFTGLQI